MSFIYSQLFITPPSPTQSFVDKTIIVTGSNVGLGKEAARHFTRLNAAKVILAVRNTSAGNAAKSDIESSTKRSGVVEVWPLDLASYASVTAFAKRAASSLERLDLLLENAGIATRNFTLAEGHESTLTVNVISTFLLACLLLPTLQASARKTHSPTHLTIVSSEVHGWTPFTQRTEPHILAALSDAAQADMPDRYPLSKLLEVLVLRHLTPSLARTYPDVVLTTTNPGLCHSALARDAGWLLWALKLVLARSTEVGSRTLVAPAATLGTESSGMYLSNGVVSEGEVSAFARSEEGASTGVKVWAELRAVLEGVQKGVTEGLD